MSPICRKGLNSSAAVGQIDLHVQSYSIGTLKIRTDVFILLTDVRKVFFNIFYIVCTHACIVILT